MLKESQEEILVVTSSDMNHYGPDDATRIKDAKAIDRLTAVDARGLFEVCRKEKISHVPGLGPAVMMLTAMKELGAGERRSCALCSTSGDVNGDRDAVVGYAGMIFAQAVRRQYGACPLTAAHRGRRVSTPIQRTNLLNRRRSGRLPTKNLRKRNCLLNRMRSRRCARAQEQPVPGGSTGTGRSCCRGLRNRWRTWHAWPGWATESRKLRLEPQHHCDMLLTGCVPSVCVVSMRASFVSVGSCRVWRRTFRC